MPEPRDIVDDWLAEPILPLPPRAGAFTLVRKRARRRKLRQVAMSAGAAAVIAAAALAVPRLASPSASPRSLAQATASGAVPAPARHGLAGFQPTSVTFVGLSQGWALGRASRCAGSAPACESLAATGDTGASWHSVTALPAAAQVSQVRFLVGARDGWVFGPQLWSTHDGGRVWQRVPTGGRKVTELETVGGRAFAIWARCGGGGAAFATSCTSFALYSSPAGADSWARVPGVPTLTAGGAPTSAALVLTQTEAYLLTPDGQVLSGPTSGGAWTAPAGQAPCPPGAAQPTGRPAGAMLASSGPGLVLACAGQAAGGVQPKSLYYSSDGGQTWQPAGTPPSAGVARSLSGSPASAGSPTGSFVLATSQGVVVSTDGGATWQPAAGVPPGGFSYVGMTYPLQGVAVPADPRTRALWITHDGGLTWQKSLIG